MLKICRSSFPSLALLFTVMLMVFGGEVKGQGRIYANNVISSNSGVTDEGNAASSNELFAKMSVGALSGAASIQLGFSTTVPANQTVYIKVSSADNITITAANSGSPVAIPSPLIFNSPDNNYFIGITSTNTFNSITIKLNYNLLSSTNNKANLYYAFYNVTNPSNCGLPFATSTETGLLSSIQTPGYAIDGNITTSANLNVTLLGEAKEIIYFPENSNTGDAIRTSFILPGGIAVLGNMSMQAFNGANPVGSPVVLGSLLNITLTGQTQYTFDFVPSGIFDRVQFKLGGLLSLTGGLNIVEVQKVPNISIENASILGLLNICGTAATIKIQNPESGVTYNWYSVASGGSPIFTGASYPVTGLTNGTTTNYYVEGVKSGCSNQLRYNVQVKSLPLPQNSPITGLNSVCNGSTITLTNATSGGVWTSNDPTKAEVDANGKVTTHQSGNVTISYTTKDLTTSCENTQTFAVTILPTPTLTSIPNQLWCAGYSIDLTTLNPTSNIAGGTYLWSTAQGGAALTSTTVTPPPGVNKYWVRYTLPTGCYSDQSLDITITSPAPLSIIQSASAINPGISVTLTAVSPGSTIKWYDQTETEITSSGGVATVGPFSTPGTYTYNVISTNGPCSSSGTATVTVYDGTICPTLTKRVYANSTTWSSVITGNVTNKDNAVDGNPATASLMTSGLGLLGVGTVTQDLFWSSQVNAGTPATVKLGLSAALLSLLPNLSIVGINSDGSEIGTPQIINASLLKLLPGDNTFEFTITPSTSTGPKAYRGVRIVLGSLLSLAQNAQIFDAYYTQPTPAVDCTKGDVVDVLYGVKDLGIGALNVSVGVSDALKSIDGDINSYAVMFSGVGLLAQARELVMFSSPSLPSDSIKIIVSTGASLLGVNLLTGFSIQRYLGASPVGPPLDQSSNLLSIKLLANNTRAAIILAPTPEPYDRIEILNGGLANVLTTINIHEIQRVTNTKLPSAPTIDNNISVCKGDLVTLPTPTDNCTTFEWYDAPVGGNLITGTTINTTSYTGTVTFYIQPVRFGCKLLTRGAVNITINDLPVSPLPTAAAICSDAKGVFVVSNPTAGLTYNWYATASGGTSLSTGTTYTTATPSANGDTYYVEATNGTCKSPRVSVAVTVNPLPTATISGTASICKDATAPSITFTANGGTAPYTFTYNINGGNSQTVSTTTGNSVGLSAPTDVSGSFIYNLISVKDNSSTQCVQSQTGTATVVVKATPTLISPLPTATCSNTVFNYNPISSINGTVLTWTRAVVSGISNSAVTTPNSGPINETLINTTTLPIDVIYIYNLTVNGCSKDFEIKVTVNPIPKLSSTQTPSPICSNTIFNYTPESTTDDVTFTWTRAAVPGLSNAAVTDESIGSISEKLINTTSLPIIVTYVYYLTKNGCTNTEGVIVTVNPSPSITLGSTPFVCQEITNTSLSYSARIANPTVYSITWGNLAQTGGFSDVPFSTLPSSPISITVPANIAAGTYSGTLTVRNGNGCISAPINFNVVVHTKPGQAHISTQ
ncbi:PKD-like domain-containing protein [Pedobacter foliorum]|uniref:Ig-like domain-containing protein n=1 Tax=Pedobacter foliorum TaxID=2739058 RepID=UPI00156685DE|nr:PKD-like domain-containing protein [Pedobacter foliorum]NRF37947.1 Ig-like domain-containing protein [Pedobacter foliorum]